MSEDDLKQTAESRLGRILRGKYRLDRVLGIGGMATVYAATHRNKKRFAIKMLHPELSIREAIRTRFLREGYVANSVDHTGAVAVIDDDVAEDGSAFLVMELLDGSPVDALAAAGGHRLPLPLVLSIGDALLDVLIAAHAKGIVHRDLKPANLFLTHDGRLEVLDFGIARLHDETSVSSTQTGAILGTPAYMAPEQAMAESTRIDAQTDLWAVGATMFALLSGTLVHTGENASQLLVFAATRPARPLASVAPEVPPAIAQVVDRALAFDKGQRWTSAGEMRDGLAKACLDATGAVIAPLPKTERVTGLEATIASSDDFGPRSGQSSGQRSGGSSARISGAPSGNAGFDPTFDALAATQAPPGAGSVATPPAASPLGPATTGAGLAATSPSVRAPRRRMPWRRLATGGVALAVIAGAAGGVAIARRPRVTYCAGLVYAIDGVRCVVPLSAEAVARRVNAHTYRLTSVGGRVQRVERVAFSGLELTDGDEDLTIVRGSDGAVREILVRDSHGNLIERHEWSDGGRRVDFVEDDGVTPRHASFGDGNQRVPTRITSVVRELDDRGLVVRTRFLGPTGRPRSNPAANDSYGNVSAYGRAGRAVRVQLLAADGAPGAIAFGLSAIDLSDDESPEGSDLRLSDLEGKPVCSDQGLHHVHFAYDDAFERTSATNFGLHDEPAVILSLGTHGLDFKWDPATRVSEQTTVDEQGRPRPWKGYGASTIRTAYDERGRLTRLDLLDADHNPVRFTHDSASTLNTWDGRDDLVAFEELDTVGAPMLNRQGVARGTMAYDAHGRVIESHYFDASGHPTPLLDEGAIVRTTRDDRGLPTSRAFFGADDRPMSNTHGYASVRMKYDHLRNEVERAYFGPDGKPCADDEGTSVVRHAYDENDDLVAVAYFDVEGAPTMHGGAWSTQQIKNDERGLVIEEAYLDAHGEPVLLRDGYARVTYARDRNGDVTDEAYFGKRGEPIVRSGGYARKKTTWSLHRQASEVALFDAAGKPVAGDDGWAAERTTYEDRGLVSRRDHFDGAGNPVVTKHGASNTVSYDGRGNVREETTLGIDGKPMAGDGGYATKKSAYDERDNLVEEALFDPGGAPVIGKDGWSVRKLGYDEGGSRVAEAFFDGDHRPVVPKALTYSSARSRFDAHQTLVERSYFDADGAPARGPEGAALVRYQRDPFGRPIETAWFDGAGAPTASKDGTFVTRAKYDDAGRLVDERFVDAKGAPRAAADGCAGHHTKYDAEGHKLEEECLDANGAPTLSVDGWAIRRTLHDARGNDVDVATYAPDGALRAGTDGIARRKKRFDERNLVQETTFFDAHDKPVHDKQGGYAVRCMYDDSGKKTGEMALDASGNPMKK